MMYANENKGQFPDDIADLLKQDLTPEVFVNPRNVRASRRRRALEGEQLAQWVQRVERLRVPGQGQERSG